jgi:hypothetical protein
VDSYSLISSSISSCTRYLFFSNFDYIVTSSGSGYSENAKLFCLVFWARIKYLRADSILIFKPIIKTPNLIGNSFKGIPHFNNIA